jgi:hypothetical protein
MLQKLVRKNQEGFTLIELKRLLKEEVSPCYRNSLEKIKKVLPSLS